VVEQFFDLEDIRARGMGPTAIKRADSKVFLDSWKEIAVFLKRGVRTVQRWEKDEGLPVHRHQHAKRASVYGLAWEIEAWFKVRAEVEVPKLPEQASQRPESRVEADDLVRACLDARQRAERARGQFSPIHQLLERTGLRPTEPSNGHLRRLRWD